MSMLPPVNQLPKTTSVLRSGRAASWTIHSRAEDQPNQPAGLSSSTNGS
jgi:hypothetical protein